MSIERSRVGLVSIWMMPLRGPGYPRCAWWAIPQLRSGPGSIELRSNKPLRALALQVTIPIAAPRRRAACGTNGLLRILRRFQRHMCRHRRALRLAQERRPPLPKTEPMQRPETLSGRRRPVHPRNSRRRRRRAPEKAGYGGGAFHVREADGPPGVTFVGSAEASGSCSACGSPAVCTVEGCRVCRGCSASKCQ